ncbi:unnamed protein product [Ranitomeya imitator]|uniref:Uncharacterized protein n=1 Tax=Ranitomeya imitator TaxID=111125 RepID=A0ABN9MHN8_9NEOB|nr:unnamed protein product [Ranitomeya imitator]
MVSRSTVGSTREAAAELNPCGAIPQESATAGHFDSPGPSAASQPSLTSDPSVPSTSPGASWPAALHEFAGNIGGLSTALQNAVDKPLMPRRTKKTQQVAFFLRPIFVKKRRTRRKTQRFCVRLHAFFGVYYGGQRMNFNPILQPAALAYYAALYSFAHIFIAVPIGAHSLNSLSVCLWNVGGNRSTRRKPTQTRREHTNSLQMLFLVGLEPRTPALQGCCANHCATVLPYIVIQKTTMLSRPKPGESEEDLLEFQKQFLADRASAAATVVRKADKRKGVSEKSSEGAAEGAGRDVVSLQDFSDLPPILTPGPTKISKVAGKRVNFAEEDLEDICERHDEHITAVISKIIVSLITASVLYCR